MGRMQTCLLAAPLALAACCSPPLQGSAFDVPAYPIVEAGARIAPDAIDAAGKLDPTKITFHATPAVDVPFLHVSATVEAQTSSGTVLVGSFGCNMGFGRKGQLLPLNGNSCDKAPLTMFAPPGAPLSAKLVVRIDAAGAMVRVPVGVAPGR